jgi:hydroxylaminobenzene mutase
MDVRSIKRQFAFAGVLLILLGLLTGFVIQSTSNPRVAMACHVEAIMGGMPLVIVGGLVWEQAQLGERAAKSVRFLFFYSAYANWFFLLLSAIWGTGKLLPIAGKGFRGTDAQELVIVGGLISSALAILAAMIALLAGMKVKTRQT